MTAQEFYSGLKSLGLSVAYRQFSEGNVPDPPFLVWYYDGTDNFSADGIAYQKICNAYVELYAEKKELEIEEKIEEWLTDNGIFYDYDEFFIESEKYIETLYMCQITGGNQKGK